MTEQDKSKPRFRDYIYALAGHTLNVCLRLMAIRNKKIAKMIRGREQTLARLDAKLSMERPTLWLHASSLGEFEQGRPLIEAIRERQPEWQIVLSFYSPSGYEVQSDYPLVDCVVYLPGDSPREVRAFLDKLRPRCAVFIKYDFWAVMLSELHRRGIPTYLVSGIFRKEQAFFKPWATWYRDLLHCFTHLYVQDEQSVLLLRGIGVEQVSISGDTRFDRVESIAKASQEVKEIEQMSSGGSPLLVAGSTWGVDEEMLCRYAEQHPELKIVFAPHELNHIDDLQARLKGAVRLSQLRAGKEQVQELRYLIIDSFGLLSSIYRYADIAYIGGGFGKSIHNTIEAAVYGIPVVFGPNYHKFREAKLLIEQGGGISVDTEEALFATLDSWLADSKQRSARGRAARLVVESQLGATELILSGIMK